MKDDDKTKQRLINESEALQTERNPMEEVLRESESKYKELAESIADVFFAFDEKLRYTYWNKASRELTGISAEDALGKHLYDLFPNTDATRSAEEAYLKVLTTKQPQHFVNEYQLGSKDYVFEISAYPSRDGLSVFVKDITEHKRIGEALRESEEKYRQLVEYCPDTIAVHSDGKIDFINPAGVRLMRAKNTEQLIGKPIIDFLHPDYRETVQKRIAQSLKEGARAPVLEEKFIRLDGKAVDVEVIVIPFTHQGKPAMQVVVRDITERKRAEGEELRKFKTISDRAGYGAAISRPDGNLVYVNQSFAKMHGYTIEDLIGKHFSILHTKEQMRLVERLRNQFLQTGSYSAEEVWHKRKDGTVFPASMTGTAIIDDKGKPLYLCATAIDITERKRVEEELRIAEQNFRNSLDSSPLGTRIVTAEGELLYANQAILDIYGYSSVEELKGVPTKQRYTPKSYAEHQERAKKRKQGKPVPSNYEVSIVRKDGEVGHLAVFRKAVIWGGEIQFQALYQDITERKRIEEALRLQSEIVANMAEGVVVTRASDGMIVYTNQKFEKMFGYGEGELLGKYVSMLNAPGDKSPQERAEEIIKSLSETGVWYGEVYNIKKDGAPFWCQVSISTLEHARLGKVWVATHEDITERKQVEMALRQSEEFNSSLLTNSPSPILVLNADASIRYVNPALERLTGFSSAELVGSKPPYPWWIEETHKELSRRLVQAMRHGIRKYESLYRKKNGERFWAEKIFKTVKVSGELKYHLVNWVDLTEQKRLKANMEFYLSEVTRAQEEERKRIAREIHDESIQSLAALALGIDAIARRKERLPEDVIRRLKRLRAEANSILDGLRQFSHELRPGVIDQVGLVPALEILTEELNQENRVKASLEVAGSDRRLMPETELALFRIGQEALRNVKKHSSATEAAIRLKFTRSRVKLTVSDNGRGFELPDMLSDFATEGKLGLIGMQERTRLLNGKLLVKSGLGRGTTVVVEVYTMK